MSGELVDISNLNDYIVHYTYGCNESGEIVPSKILNWQLTKVTNRLVEVTMTNDFKVLCTEDHEIMLRDGTYKEAKDLTVDDSIMSFYSKVEETGRYAGYEKLLDGTFHSNIFLTYPSITHTLLFEHH